MDSNTLGVVFGFQYLQDGYDLSGAQAKQSSDFIQSLKKRSKLTWAQIHNLPRNKLGLEKISDALKDHDLENIPLEYHEKVVCFRFGGNRERCLGFRVGQIFEVVWIDHSGTLYDHGS